MRYLLVVLVVGCTGTIDPVGPQEVDAGTSAADAPVVPATPGSGSVARAREWSDAQLHYCQAPNHKPDADADCPSTCDRMDNLVWDPYRSDCSGLVSWAWALPAPGRTTKDFAPFKTDLSHVIAAADLRAGDAVNNDNHIMLFAAWVAPGTAIFIDEPGCSSATPYAQEFMAGVTTTGNRLDIEHRGTFTAIRYDAAP